MMREVSTSHCEVATCEGPTSPCFKWGGGDVDGLLGRQGCPKVASEEAFDSGP
jgi:hypothetical protein